MPKVLAKYKGYGIFKVGHGSDLDSLSKISVGDEVSINVTKPRNIKFHRKFFSLLRVCYINLPEYLESRIKNEQDLLNVFKIELGYYSTTSNLSGVPIVIPESISFAKMDDLSFADFYERAVNLVINKILVGANKDDLLRMIAESY